MTRRTQAARVVLIAAWVAVALGAVLLRYPALWDTSQIGGGAAEPATPHAPEPPAGGPDSTPAAPRTASVGERAGAFHGEGERLDTATDALHVRAEAARRAGRDEAALALYLSAEAAGALPSDARVQLAWLLATTRRYAEAWDAAAPLDDRVRPHLEVRARVAAWGGRDATAVALLRRWLELAPSDADAWALLTDAERRLGDPSWRTSRERVLALRPRDLDVRRTLASELAGSGDLNSAIALMQEVLREPAHTASDWVAIGQLHEQGARLTDAVTAYENALAFGNADPDVYRRFARVLRWTSQPARAVNAYQRLFERSPAERTALSGELGLALLDAGRPWDALAALDAAVAADATDAALWVATAQAAEAAGDPQRVVSALRVLARLRPLSSDEARWLAGQLEAAGQAVDAVAAYREILHAENGSDRQLWERVGDLEADLGRPAAALDAYDRALTGSPSPAVWLKVARAAAAAGRHDRAADTYARSIQADPDGRDVPLEAARHLASVHDPARALAFYEEYLARSGTPAGMYMELARAALAAGRPLDALRWTTEGIAAGERSAELLFVRAQSLHLAGRPAESAALLRRLLTGEPRNIEWRTWLAWTAQARGRSLEAFEMLGAVIEEQGARRPDLWIARGDAAAMSGDALRARASYAEALATGADTRAVAERLEGLPAQAQLAAPVEIIRDSNGLELVRGGGQFLVRPGQVAQVSGSWAAGHLAQEGRARFAHHAMELGIDQFLPSPRVVLDGGVGLQQSAGATVPLWRVSGAYRSPGGARLALMAFRETPWSTSAPLTHLRFSRIRRLDDLGAGFSTTGTTVAVDLPLSDRQAFFSSASFKHQSDANAARQLYLQYQRELTAGGPAWVAIQPHVYVEAWRTSSPAYYSPDRHVTAGVSLRAIGDVRGWHLDATVIPDARFSEARRGAGLTVSSGLTRRIGRGSARMQLMWFDDRRYGFRAWRLTAEVGIPVVR